MVSLVSHCAWQLATRRLLQTLHGHYTYGLNVWRRRDSWTLTIRYFHNHNAWRHKVSSIHVHPATRALELLLPKRFWCMIPDFGSRPSDHYFRSVCLSVRLFVCAEFFSSVWSDFDQTRTHVIRLGLVVSPRIYWFCAIPGGWVTPKNLYF